MLGMNVFFSLHLLLCELIHLCSVGKLLLFVVNILSLGIVIKNELLLFSPLLLCQSMHLFVLSL